MNTNEDLRARHVRVLQNFASAYAADSENGQALRAAIAALAPHSGGEGDDDWLRHLGALVCASKDRDASREDQEAAIDKAHAALYRAIRRLATPTPQGVSDAVVQLACRTFWNCTDKPAHSGEGTDVPRMRAALEAVWPTAAGAAQEPAGGATPTPQAAGVSEELAGLFIASLGDIPDDYSKITTEQVIAAIKQNLPDYPNALTAAGAAPEGWQPIETAPHTGISVLLWQPWKSGRDCAVIGHYANGWVDRDNEDMQPEPTHWQPMPASPATPNPGAQHGQEG